MEQIQLNVTLDETNLIIQCLAKQPYSVVMDIIPKIQKQAQQQLATSKEAVNGPGL